MLPPLRASLLLAVLSAIGGIAAHAQAGPPFLTDDPETPGNHHWEINAGWLGARNSGHGDYEVPDFDFNYGLGDRIQLKYELPIAIHEDRPQPGTPGHVLGGLGESLLGVKYRFYEHRPAGSPPDLASLAAALPAEVPEANFSVSTYPQLSLDNPTRAVPRGVVTPGPQFLLPLEANARIGPIRVDGEIGYWFTPATVPQSWIRGFIAGHEFTPSTELYVELHDQQDANRVNGQPKQRSFTLGGGGRHAFNRSKSILALFMAGRSLQRVAADNSQPSWIAYLGVQFLLGPEALSP
jgi:hypothetical protein